MNRLAGFKTIEESEISQVDGAELKSNSNYSGIPSSKGYPGQPNVKSQFKHTQKREKIKKKRLKTPEEMIDEIYLSKIEFEEGRLTEEIKQEELHIWNDK